MNPDDMPSVEMQRQRLDALYSQQPPPQWGMAWFGGSAPYGNQSSVAMGPAPSILPLLGMGIAAVAIIATLGTVVSGHLSSTRETALRSARQEIAALRAERDRANATITQARQQLEQIRAAHAESCAVQQAELSKATAALGGSRP